MNKDVGMRASFAKLVIMGAVVLLGAARFIAT